jgi:excisionase family DNA binding protein
VTYYGDHLLTPDQAAEQLHVKVGTLAQWRSQGRGPVFTRVGGLVMYERSDLQAYLVARREQETPKQRF